MRFNPKSAIRKVFFQEITPTEAQEILDQCNHDNFRKMRSGAVNRYKTEMKEKNWVDGVTTVDFDPNGTLLNGQHTLQACVESGRTIEVTVRVGMPAAAKVALDSGLIRRESDAIGESATFVAIGRWIYEPSEFPDVLGRTRMLKTYEKHREAIEFVLGNMPRSRAQQGIRIGPVLSVVARAWYTEDKDRLQTFLVTLATGMSNGFKYDNAVVRLREFLRQEPVRGARRCAAYWATQRILRAYLDGVNIQAVTKASKELFPTPYDSKARAELKPVELGY